MATPPSPVPGRLRFLRAIGAAILCVLTGLIAYIALLSVATGGHAVRALDYWWRVLPSVQFWYFGGTPGTFFHRLSDLLNPDICLYASAAFLLHYLGFRFRKPGLLTLHVGLFGYGVVSLLPLLGALGLHYLSGLWCTGLIAVFISEMPGRLRSWLGTGAFRSMLNAIFSIACLGALARVAFLQSKNKSRLKNPAELHCSVLPSNGSPARSSFIPAFVGSEAERNPGPDLMRSFYRSIPEISLNQGGVGRYDYIIHALGVQQQSEYLAALEQVPPLFLRTPVQKSFPHAQWLWHHWPDLWLWILSRYQFEGIHAGSSYWRRSPEMQAPKFRSIPAEFSMIDNVARITARSHASGSRLWKLRVTYSTKPIAGPISGPVDRMTRVVVSVAGVCDSQPFAWPPSSKSTTREVLLIPLADAGVNMEIECRGPLLNSKLEVEAISLEECETIGLAGLVAMLK
jgi:hypothetical protein